MEKSKKKKGAFKIVKESKKTKKEIKKTKTKKVLRTLWVRREKEKIKLNLLMAKILKPNSFFFHPLGQKGFATGCYCVFESLRH